MNSIASAHGALPTCAAQPDIFRPTSRACPTLCCHLRPARTFPATLSSGFSSSSLGPPMRLLRPGSCSEMRWSGGPAVLSKVGTSAASLRHLFPPSGISNFILNKWHEACKMWMAMQPGCKRARLRLSSQPSDADWKLNQYSQLRFAAPRQAASNAKLRSYIPSLRSQVEQVGRVAMCSRLWLMPKVSDEWANDRFYFIFLACLNRPRISGAWRRAPKPQASIASRFRN